MKYQILKIVQNLTSIWLKQQGNQKVLQFEKEKKLFGFPKYILEIWSFSIPFHEAQTVELWGLLSDLLL